MRRVRSVSGHVSPVRYPKPVPLRSRRITSVHRYYGHLRLPIATALFLAVQACRRVRLFFPGADAWVSLVTVQLLCQTRYGSKIPGG
jgi:hypothetical protein